MKKLIQHHILKIEDDINTLTGKIYGNGGCDGEKLMLCASKRLDWFERTLRCWHNMDMNFDT